MKASQQKCNSSGCFSSSPNATRLSAHQMLMAAMVLLAGLNAFEPAAHANGGVPLWTNRYGVAGGAATSSAITVDGRGNVFVTGKSSTANSYAGYATVAYSGAGVALWTNRYVEAAFPLGKNRYYGPGNEQDEAKAIVDKAGNVFVTGGSSELYYGYFATVCYSAAGLALWTNRYAGNGDSYATGIAVDSSGNAFVTGCVGDGYATVAYSRGGTPLWTNRYGESEASFSRQLSAIALDNAGNVFVTGSLGPWNTPHYFTIKYSSSKPPNMSPVVTCPSAATVECGTPIELTAKVSDPDGDALSVFWTINGQLVQRNSVPASESEVGTNVSFIADLPLGTNVVGVLVSDEATNTTSCSTTITVVDTIPPVIVSAIASPSVLWPPNHQMVPVNVRARVTDNCGPAVWEIIDVRSNEPGRGDGKTGPDWVITGDHTVNLRAERSGKDAGRIYSIILQATDAARNLSGATTVQVTVPKSQGSTGPPR